jgi:thioesterase domain-containing protein
MRALARDYVGEILKRQIDGPIHLVGFSSGSLMAFEMARQLRNLGIEVGLLALMDGEINGEGPRMPAAVKYAKMVRRKLYKIAFKLEDELAEGPKVFVMKRLRHLWLHFHVRVLEKFASTGEVTVAEALLMAEHSYQAEPYEGSVLLMRFHDEAWAYGPDPLMGWSGLVKGDLNVVDLEGGHITGMTPAGAPTIVSVLRDYIQKYEAGVSQMPPSSAEKTVA